MYYLTLLYNILKGIINKIVNYELGSRNRQF